MNPDNESKKLAMMHTGEHIFFKCLEKQLKSSEQSEGRLGTPVTKELKLEKISLDEEESSLFVMAEGLSWEIIFKAEQEANRIIKENREVISHETTKEDIEEFPGLRIKLERIKEEKIRIIEIKNHDFSACSGEHCKTTGEVNNLLVTKFRKAPTGFEIRFKVDAEKELFELANTARFAMDALGTEQEKVIPTIKNLKDDVERCRKAMKSQKIEAKEENIGGLCFVYAVFDNMDKKVLTEKANELIKEKTVLCFLNKSDTLQVMIMCSQDSNKDASLIVKALNQKLGGKGGGKKSFAMCSVNEGNADKVLNAVKDTLTKEE
jgi:alanyl-tRNA synthetase